MIQDTSSQDRAISRPPRRGRFLWSIAAIVSVLIVGSLVWHPRWQGWIHADTSVDRARLMTGTVQRGDLTREVSAEGRVVASSYPTLYSTASGVVTLRVKAGEAVASGQVLAVVDSPEVRNLARQEASTVQAMEADLARRKVAAKAELLRRSQAIDLAKLRHEAAERAFARAEQTFSQGLINAIEYETAKDSVLITDMEYEHAVAERELDRETLDLELRNMELQLSRQKLVLAEVQRRLEELSIRSPADGRIGSLEVDPSDVVAANMPLLTVIDLSAFEVEVSIPETYADDIEPGQPADIRLDDQIYPGEVAQISPEVVDSLVTGTVLFRGPPPQRLRQNQRVSARIRFETRDDVLYVRRGPFLESGAGRVAYVINDGLLERREIQVGVASLTEVEILRGLRAGEEIVISDLTDFRRAETVLLRP